MRKDDFGNLSDWGDVLQKLDRLRRSGELEGHQAGLARLIRYRNNWRLRQAALASCREISKASDVLIADVLNTLADEQTPLELRVLAANALGHLLPRYAAEAGALFDVERAVENVGQVAARVQPPVLADAIREVLAVVGARTAGGTGSTSRAASSTKER